jgi:alpha-amylase
VANGDFTGGTCSGTSYVVSSAGQFTATVPANGMLALHINARGTSSGCSSVATTFSVTAPQGPLFVVGNQPALGNWAPASAVPLTQSADVWSATVALPPNTAVQYKYIRKDAAGAVTWEYDPNRARTTPTTCAVTWTDTWNGPVVAVRPSR